MRSFMFVLLAKYVDDERRRMRWVGHVAYMGSEKKIHSGFWLENLKERCHLEDLKV